MDILDRLAKSKFRSRFKLRAKELEYIKDKGLDTIPTYTSVRFPDVIRQAMEIPDDETLAIGISIGYPKDATINTYQSKREPVEKILKFKD